MRCKFKKEGDGFFMDSVCNNGYTITFYPRNQPAPSNYIRLGHSPLHSRSFFLLNQLEENSYHQIFYDNLHTSLKLTKGAIIYARSKCLTRGACRMKNRGLPISTMLGKVTRKVDKASMVGTTKASVLNADEHCPNVITFSAHDQKPVYFLSTVMDSISWETFTTKKYDVDLNKKS